MLTCLLYVGYTLCLLLLCFTSLLTYVASPLQGFIPVTNVSSESQHKEEAILFSGPNGTPLVTIATQTAEAFLPLDYKDGSRDVGSQNLAALYHGGWALDSGPGGKRYSLPCLCYCVSACSDRLTCVHTQVCCFVVMGAGRGSDGRTGRASVKESLFG